MINLFVQITRNYLLERIWSLGIIVILLTVAAVLSWIRIFSSGYIELESALQRRGTQQVFFDDGGGIREELSHREYIEEPFSFVRYSLPLPTENLLMIRVDPVDVEGWVKFKKLEIKPRWSWRSVPLLNDEVPLSGIQELRFEKDQNLWTVIPEFGNTDPALLLKDLPLSPSGNELRNKKIISLSMFFVLIPLFSIIVDFLIFRFIGNLRRALSKGMLWVSHNPLFTWGTLFVCGGISITLILVMLPEKSDPVSHIRFQWSGFPTEFIQLDYDCGHGFVTGQSRLYFNRTASSELELDFRVPHTCIRRLRITIQGNSSVGRISNLRIEKNVDGNHHSLDLSQLSDNAEVVVITASAKVFEFSSPNMEEVQFQLDDMHSQMNM